MRYMVQTDPSRPEALAAMLPQSAPAGDGKALFWGGANVVGQPGTVPQYSPAPSAMSDDSWGHFRQGSHCSPDYIMPSEYWTVADNRWSHVRTQSNNVMPVPAVNPQNMAGVAMNSPQVGGVFQVAQPQATQSWPDLNGGSGADPSGGFGNAGWRYNGTATG